MLVLLLLRKGLHCMIYNTDKKVTDVKNTDAKSNGNILDFPTKRPDGAAIGTGEKTNRTKRIKRKRNGSATALIVAVIAAIIATVYFRMSDDSSFSGSSDVSTDTINILSSDNYAFADYKEGYIYASDGKISCYNTNNELQWEINGSKTEPTVKSNGKYALIYYKNDNLAIITDGTYTREINTDGNVIYGDVNKNGYTALIVEESGFKNQIAVYDRKAKSLYKWHNSSEYITSVHISDNNRNLAAGAVELNEGSVDASVVLIDIKKEKDKKSISFSDSIICDIKFISKNNFVAVLDTKTVCCSVNESKKWEIDYGGNTLVTYDISDTNNTVLVFGDDSAMSGSEIRFYDSGGKSRGSYKSEDKAERVDMKGKTALLVYDRKISALSIKGKKLSEHKLNYDIKDCIFLANKKCALVISGSGAELVSPQ